MNVIEKIVPLACSALLLICSHTALAQNASQQSKALLSQNKQIIEEIVHSFVVRKFDPELSASGNGVPDIKSPEQAALNWMIAMKQSSYQNVLSYWDANARKQFKELDLKNNKSPQDWEQEWRRLFTGNLVTITHRINYGDYVLLAIVLKNPANQVLNKETLVFQNREGGWLLTNELATNVVLTNWDGNQNRIQRLAAPLFKRLESK